jgi:hypothetical protein
MKHSCCRKTAFSETQAHLAHLPVLSLTEQWYPSRVIQNHLREASA